jgi:heme exporter protein A
VDQQIAIELRGLTRRFGERAALRDTLLRVLATLLRPHSGEVSVLGQALPRQAHAVRPKVGLLSHEPLLYRDLSGRENLRYHAQLHRVPAERVEELLETVGMGRRADDPVRSLSRGMVQRLAVCRAVLHDPEVLLLDEPRANLDPAAVELVEPLIGRGNGHTRVLTSHDPRSALHDADLVLGLSDGKAAFVRSPSDVTPEQLRDLYE